MLGVVAAVTAIIAGAVAIWTAIQGKIFFAFACLVLGFIGVLITVFSGGR